MKNGGFVILFALWILACGQQEKVVVHEAPTKTLETIHSVYLTNNKLKTYLSSALKVKPNLACQAPFKDLHYDKVIAYDYEGSMEAYVQVVEVQGFSPVITKQQFLNQEQVNGLTQLLSAPSSYGETTAACFEPHLGIVFYQSDTMVLQLNICLDCNRITSTLPIPATQTVLVNEGEALEYAREGFSESAVSEIVSLFKALDFSYGRRAL